MDRLLELAVKHGCDELALRCEVCIEIKQLIKEIKESIKLEELVKNAIVRCEGELKCPVNDIIAKELKYLIRESEK